MRAGLLLGSPQAPLPRRGPAQPAPLWRAGAARRGEAAGQRETVKPTAATSGGPVEAGACAATAAPGASCDAAGDSAARHVDTQQRPRALRARNSDADQAWTAREIVARVRGAQPRVVVFGEECVGGWWRGAAGCIELGV